MITICKKQSDDVVIKPGQHKVNFHSPQLHTSLRLMTRLKRIDLVVLNSAYGHSGVGKIEEDGVVGADP
jgi:hypothetical protein